MAWFRRRPDRAGHGRVDQERVSEAQAHLESFVRSRTGVEAFVEPPTTVTPETVLLVAATGEWTRRRIGNRSTLDLLSHRLHVPVYDVQLVGYPQRMRDWNARVRASGRAGTD